MSIYQVLSAGRGQNVYSTDPALQNHELLGELVLVNHDRMRDTTGTQGLLCTQQISDSAVPLEFRDCWGKEGGRIAMP